MATTRKHYATVTVYNTRDELVSTVGPQLFDSLEEANAWAVSQYRHYTSQCFRVEFRIS